MLNPVKIHENLWSLASMFNWSTVRGGEGEECEGGKVTLSGKETLRPDHSSLYHNFPFATNFNLLSRADTCKENIMKQAGGKSFTIDSLLGINAAQVAIQSRFHPTTHSNCHGEENDTSWLHEKRHHIDQMGRENRTTAYHSLTRKERNHPYTNVNTTDKSGEKLQKSSRRSAKSKRVRTIFTPDQLERLEAEFERQQYMVGPERLYLASSLYLTEAQVKVWFQNRRIKWRKQHLEMQQQRLAIFRSKGSHVDNGEDDLYEEESDEDSSKSDSSPLAGNNVPLLTSFTGSLHQEPLSDSESESNNVHPECSRNPKIMSRHNHNVESQVNCHVGDNGSGRDSLSTYVTNQQSSSLFE